MKHLIYHVYEAPGALWNLEQLEKRISIFDGSKTAALAYDEDKEPSRELYGYLKALFDDIIYVPNHPRIREAQTFPVLLQEVRRLCRDGDAVFFAHTKGTTRHDHPTSRAVKKWTQIMYEFCLTEEAASKIGEYRFVGCFKKKQKDSLNNLSFPQSPWCYCGTFFWFDASYVFSNPIAIKKDRLGVEGWPGEVCYWDEGLCLLGQNPGNLYEDGEVERLLDLHKRSSNFRGEV